jgi:hypothetical protein
MIVTMPVVHGLEEKVEAVAEGRSSVEELRLWLGERVQAVADANNAHVTELSDRAWILVAEWLDGLRDESSVRCELSEALAELAPRL